MENIFYVVIPCYNVQDYLEACIQSLQNQTYDRFYAVLVDDGSKDETLSRCMELAGKDSRLIVLKHEQNQGLEATRNTALDYAETFSEQYHLDPEQLWICFLDADDTLKPDTFERINSVCSGSKHVDFVLTGFEFIYSDHREKCLPDMAEGFYSAREIAEHLEKEIPWPVMSCVGTKYYRYSFMQHNHFRFDSYYKYNEDAGFALNAFMNAETIALIRDCKYEYLQREGSIMHSYRKGLYDGLNHVARLYEDYYRKFGLERTYLTSQNRMIIAWGAMIDEYSAGKNQYSLFFDRITNDSEVKKSLKNVLASSEASAKERLLAFGMLHHWKKLIGFYIRTSFLQNSSEHEE